MKLIKPIFFTSLLLGTTLCFLAKSQDVPGNTLENPPEDNSVPDPNQKCFKLFGEPVCSSEVVNGVYQINDMELFANCEEFGKREGNTCTKTENGVKFNINNKF
jgi:hypothetical protein